MTESSASMGAAAPAKTPSVSVITVVRNGAAVLERTLTSVCGQTWPRVEVIVIDGASVDGTVEVIKRHADRIHHWVSEPDRGIYDAMNKGMAAATGDYLWFINAGDEAHAPDVLAAVFAAAPVLADVYYGDTEFVDAAGRSLGLRSQVSTHPLPTAITWRDMARGMVMCHQAIIVRRSLAPRYDLRHRYAADCEWVIRCLRGAEGIRHVPRPLARYLHTDGFSRRYRNRYLWDRFRVLRRHFGFASNALSHLAIVMRASRHGLQGWGRR